MNRCFSLIFALLTMIGGVMATSSCSMLPGRSSDTMVIIYIAADNNLASSAMADIQEIVDGYVPDYCEPGERGNVLLLFVDLPSSEPQLIRLYKDRGLVNIDDLVRNVARANNKNKKSSNVGKLTNITYPTILGV